MQYRNFQVFRIDGESCGAGKAEIIDEETNLVWSVPFIEIRNRPGKFGADNRKTECVTNWSIEAGAVLMGDFQDAIQEMLAAEASGVVCDGTGKSDRDFTRADIEEYERLAAASDWEYEEPRAAESL